MTVLLGATIARCPAPRFGAGGRRHSIIAMTGGRETVE